MRGHYRKQRKLMPRSNGGGGAYAAVGDVLEVWRRLADLVPADERRRCEDEAAELPFMLYWHIYAVLPAVKRMNASMISGRRRAWRGFAEWMRMRHPETQEIAAVTRGMCEEYLDNLKMNHSNVTCNIYKFMIRDVFRTLLGEFWPGRNPWDDVECLPCDMVARRELATDEIRRLINAAIGKGREWAMLFRLAAYTGMRLGDCCSLEWKDVLLERGVIQVIPGKARKRRRGRPVTIPIHAKLKRHLLKTSPKMRNGPVLPEIAGLYRRGAANVTRILGGIFTKAGIVATIAVKGRARRTSHASFHSLRHSFVSYAANAGVPLEAVRTVVGHETSAMTRHYYHAEEAMLRRAVSAIPSFDATGKCVSGDIRADARPAAAKLVELADALRRRLVSRMDYAVIRQEILSSV